MADQALHQHESRLWTSHEPAANTAAVVTIAAATNKYHHISQVVYSYDADPTGGSLTITDGTYTVVVDITTTGPGSLYFPREFASSLGSAITVTLAAGGAGVTGKLNVQSD